MTSTQTSHRSTGTARPARHGRPRHGASRPRPAFESRPAHRTAPPLTLAEITRPTTPITGLSTFHLGTVPASVTPPRSWRRAAWFAVGSAAAVVVALVVAAVVLVGKPSLWQTVDALPGLPAATNLDTPADADQATTPPRPGDRHPSRFTVAPPTNAPPEQAPNAASSTAPSTAPSTPAPTSGPASTTTAVDAGPAHQSRPGPQRTTRAPYLVSTVDAQQLGDRTEQYYATVVPDPAAASAMTSGPMLAGGPQGIRARYRDVTGVRVDRITIDPGAARTTNEVTLRHRDGSTTTERRVLRFSPGADPHVTDDAPG